MTEGVRIRVVDVREKEVSEQKTKELSQYKGRYGLIASWVTKDNIAEEVPLIILDGGEVLYGSQVWWERL